MRHRLRLQLRLLRLQWLRLSRLRLLGLQLRWLLRLRLRWLGLRLRWQLRRGLRLLGLRLWRRLRRWLLMLYTGWHPGRRDWGWGLRSSKGCGHCGTTCSWNGDCRGTGLDSHRGDASGDWHRRKRSGNTLLGGWAGA